MDPIKKRIFDPPSIKKKNKENEIYPIKIDRVEAEIQAYTHTHTFIQTFFKNHVFSFLTPRKTIITCFYNNSKNYYHKASSRGKQKNYNHVNIHLKIFTV